MASSDEAEEDRNSDNVIATATTTAAEAMATDLNFNDDVSFVRQVSDAGSTTSCARQVSDSSSSSGGGGIGSTGAGYAFEGETDDFVVSTGFDDFAQGSAVAAAGVPSAAVQQSWNGVPFGAGNYSTDDAGNNPGVVPISSGPLAGGSWRSPTAGGPRVTVRIRSPSDGSIASSSTSRQRSMTVPPPWPMSAVPHSSMMHHNWHRRHRHPHGHGGSEEEDGSLVLARYGQGDNAKMLIEMDRLRLVDPETTIA